IVLSSRDAQRYRAAYCTRGTTADRHVELFTRYGNRARGGIGLRAVVSIGPLDRDAIVTSLRGNEADRITGAGRRDAAVRVVNRPAVVRIVAIGVVVSVVVLSSRRAQ